MIQFSVPCPSIRNAATGRLSMPVDEQDDDADDALG